MSPLFLAFARRKEAEARTATLDQLITASTGSGGTGFRTIGNTWTREHYDGLFHLPPEPPDRPAVSLVFVQSRDGNTAAHDPGELGGGPLDKHLIYEGLSRVAADAVLAGAATARGANVCFSLWRDELVALRQELGLPRHPAQVVVSHEGRLDVDALVFNEPDLRVFVLAGEICRTRCREFFAARPWITVVPIIGRSTRGALEALRIAYGIHRVSAVGGRSIASSLLDDGVVQDLCLTTTARTAGDPDTPYYVGNRPPHLELIVGKHEVGSAEPIRFEHFAVT